MTVTAAEPAAGEPAGPPVVVTTPTVTTPTGSGAQTITPLDNVTDPDGDPLKVVGVTQPANGSAVLNADGTVTYTPDRGFAGADSFAYTVTDGTTAVAGTVELMVGSVDLPADLPITGGAVAPYALAGLLMLLAGALLRVTPSGHRPGRSPTRITCFSPDHTSSIAQTLTSTRPCARANSRTPFSSRSVAMPEERFGQATHSAPAGGVSRCSTCQRRRNLA
ncbi:cadherin-like domain-containing protein [Dactylosporangium sp. NBC_01737]|uniref:cadherin-like domain-containing protein n=1 Tax=Dactylosporangium sp. NBC_01737 TaxID=2975959 RepID=UPI002E10A13A|nr:cadherin-like domain-containing protein [Dactylosporangium sp. NBC_01737]